MNTAYPLIPVSVIIIAAYAITWLYAQWSIFSQSQHRKFWNYILLITFIISGIAGLISVVKVNYKIEIPYYDLLLKWHVSFGIGMVIISVFHFIDHFSYYFPRLVKGTSSAKKTGIHQPGIKLNEKYRYLLIFLGMLSMINQIIFIREFMSVFAGNELILGVIMSAWLLLTGWGAYKGRKKISRSFNINRGLTMLLFLAFSPAVMMVMLYLLKYMLFPPGTITGLTISLTGSFLLLFPVCFLGGYLFTALASRLSESGSGNLIGKAYSYESVGSLTGGLLFSLILGRYFTSFQVIGLTTGLILFAGSILTVQTKKLKFLVFIASGLIIPILFFIFNPDLKLKKLLYPNQEILLNKSTRYGNLIVTEQAGQFNFYENNSLQFYTENMMINEEAVHFTMARHQNPKQVLLISGGIAGMIKEIKKYSIDKITYLETNPEVFLHWEKFQEMQEKDNIVEIIKSDARSFLRRTDNIYDVILINLPPPSTLGYNRFYTSEFFKTVKKHCNQNTIVSTSLPSLVNYPEENALDIQSSLWKTLELYFNHQLLLPGEQNYFLASDVIPEPNVTEIIDQKGIETAYVNKYYIDDNLLNMRSNTLVSQFEQSAKINHDFKPFMFLRQSGHWLSHFNTNYRYIIIIPALLFILLFFKQNAITAGLYTGGFSATSLEIVMMLAYQIFAGSIYLASAFFFTAFMGGLAAGSYRKIKISGKTLVKSYYNLQFLIALFALMLPVFINLIDFMAGWMMLVRIFFILLVFTLAFGIGFEFNLASVLQKSSYSETSGINYSTDLTGSAFGAFITALILLPIAGLTYTCIIIAGLNILSGLIAYSARGKQIFA
jgi:spermidine synthase